jgi:rhodanese-related sulfurtransferase
LTPALTASDLETRPDAQLIDVRSPSEFASGHIPGAISIPMDQIESRLADLHRGPIILICQMGKRAQMTADLLAPCGLDLAVLEGGTAAWIQSGHPVVRNVKTRWSLERQVRLGAGLIVLTASTLAFTTNFRWLALAAFVGAGLTFAGLTDVCPMAELLQRMPWNRRSRCQLPIPAQKPSRSRP